MVEVRDIYDKVYDLTNTRDLTAIQDMCRRPDKYRFEVDETINLLFRHIRYKRIKKDGTFEIHDEVFDVRDPRDASEIEYMSERPEEFKFLVDEPINLPHRHIRYEVLPRKE